MSPAAALSGAGLVPWLLWTLSPRYWYVPPVCENEPEILIKWVLLAACDGCFFAPVLA